MPAHPPGHLTSSSSPPWAAQGGTLNFVKSKELQIGIFQKRNLLSWTSLQRLTLRCKLLLPTSENKSMQTPVKRSMDERWKLEGRVGVGISII